MEGTRPASAADGYTKDRGASDWGGEGCALLLGLRESAHSVSVEEPPAVQHDTAAHYESTGISCDTEMLCDGHCFAALEA